MKSVPNLFERAQQAAALEAATPAARRPSGPPRSPFPAPAAAAGVPAADAPALAATAQDVSAQDVSAYDEALPPQPLSRAERLRNELASKVPEQKSKYVEGLLEVAKRRKLAQEKAYERKFVREQQEEEAELGPAAEKFVTKGYESRLEERRQVAEADARKDALPRDAGRFMTNLLQNMGGEAPAAAATASSLAVSGAAHARPFASAPSTRQAPVRVDAQELRRKQAERLEARRAPPSRITPDLLQEARRALALRVEWT